MPQDNVVNIACFDWPGIGGEQATTDTTANFLFAPVQPPLPNGAGYIYSLDGEPEQTYTPQGNDENNLELTFTELSLGLHNFKCRSVSRGGLEGGQFDLNWEIVS